MKNWKLNLYVVWVSQIISLMGFGLCLPFIPYYIQDLGITDTSQLNLYTGLLNSLPALGMALMAPVWGLLSDRFGRKTMMLRAVTAGFFILVFMGLASTPNQLLVLRCIQGLFTGTVTAATTLIATNTPNHRMSYALGFLSSSTFIGYSSGPVIGGFIAEAFGYQITFFVGAALMLVNCFIVLFMVKESKKPQKEVNVSPVISDQGSSFNKKLFVGLMVSLLSILFLLRMSRSMFAPFLSLYVQDIRGTIVGSSSVTGLVSGLAGFATALSGIISGKLGDRFDKVKIMRIAMVSSLLVAIPLMFIGDLRIFALVYALLMFAAGGIEPLTMSITSQYTPAEKRGFLFGIQAMVASIGWSLSPIIGSYASTQYSYSILFGIISVIMALSVTVTFSPYIRQLIQKDKSPDMMTQLAESAD